MTYTAFILITNILYLGGSWHFPPLQCYLLCISTQTLQPSHLLTLKEVVQVYPRWLCDHDGSHSIFCLEGQVAAPSCIIHVMLEGIIKQLLCIRMYKRGILRSHEHAPYTNTKYTCKVCSTLYYMYIITKVSVSNRKYIWFVNDAVIFFQFK